jgi:predicted amidohydrolase
MRDFRAAAVQMESAPGDKQANLERVRALAAAAVERGAELVLFPECCLTGYWFLRKLDHESLDALSEPAPDGPSSQALLRLSRELKAIVGAGFLEKADGRIYNAFAVALPDGGFHLHRKLHAFIHEHVSCGSAFTVFDAPMGRLAVLTCYDNNLIENVRIAALKGADVLLAPHQTGGCASSNPHKMGLVDRRLWENRLQDPAAIEAELAGPKGRGWLMRWLPSRAHDNGLFLVFSNGIGVDDDEIRTGNAMILDPYGRILAETCKAGDDLVVADLRADLLEDCSGRRWIRARRPELYPPLCARTGTESDTRTVRFGKTPASG